MTPKEARGHWVEALRSGRYEQTMEVLNRGDRFCCLGVACDIYRQLTGRGSWRDGRFFVDNITGLYTTLPDEVQSFFGLQDNIGVYNTGSLAELNDLYRNTFDEIADVIAQEPDGLIE